MLTLDIAKIVELVEAKKTDEAAALFDNYFKTLTSAEKGKAYVDIAAIYLQMTAENNQELLEILDDQLKKLKELDKMEKDLDQGVAEKVELDDIRKKLNG